MSRVAFLFPGQGAQKVGMGREAFEAGGIARDTFLKADQALGYSLSALCFDGPEDDLQKTANTQPAIVTTSVALLRAFGEKPDAVAGHSLGEYSANVCAGAMRFEDAIRVVHARGQYMQQAVPDGEGAMAAVMIRDRELVESTCARTDGVVEPVNYNSPGQIVIAGAAPAVLAASESLRKAGAKVVPLSVSAPFHCSLMAPAEERLAPELDAIEFGTPEVPIFTNVDAASVQQPEDARIALKRQVSRPVMWELTIRNMVENGVSLFVEIGPGKVLSGLLARIDKSAKRAHVASPDDFESARQAIRDVRGIDSSSRIE